MQSYQQWGLFQFKKTSNEINHYLFFILLYATHAKKNTVIPKRVRNDNNVTGAIDTISFNISYKSISNPTGQ